MSEASQQMNRLLAARARGGSRAEVAQRLFGSRVRHAEGLIDRLPGADLSDGRRERLSAAEARFEAAVKAGDEIARDIADAEIDGILNESRAARAAVQEAAGGQAEPELVDSLEDLSGGLRGVGGGSAFDGGVQRRPHRPAYRKALKEMNESPAALFRRAFQASAERRV